MHPLPQPSSHTPEASPALMAFGRRVATAYAERPLTEDETEQVALAYARLACAPRTLVHHEPTQDCWFVVIDTRMWVVDAGLPWCFDLPKGIPVDDPAPFVARYAQHRSGEMPLPLCTEPWFLTSFCKAARSLAKGWAEIQDRQAFEQAATAAAYTPHWMQHDETPGPDLTQRIRFRLGRHHNMTYQLRIIGAALRALRQVMDPELCRVVWATAYLDGRLVHWLASAPDARTRLWRSQALRLHRLILPKLLLWEHDQNATQLFRPDLQPVIDRIDAGLSYDDALCELLNRHGGQWTPRHLKWMAQKGRYLPSWNNVRNLFNLVDTAMGLHPDRRFKRQEHWRRWQGIMNNFRHWLLPLPSERMEAFLRGCPTNWDDPFYTTLRQNLVLIRDTYAWVDHAPLWRALPQHLTLRQMLNLAQRLHAVHQQFITALREEQRRQQEEATGDLAQLERQQDALCQWEAAGASDAWVHQGHVVHELRSLADTWEEGERLNHCVGNGAYATKAALGQCRLFSIREQATGRSISTFELAWDERRAKLVLVQHFGRDDTPPSAMATATLRAWRRAKRCQAGPWPSQGDFAKIYARTQELQRLQGDVRITGPVAEQFRQTIGDEIVRRFPVLAAARALPDERGPVADEAYWTDDLDLADEF